MKKFTILSAICLSFVLAGTIGAFAQDDHHDREEERKVEEHKKDEHKKEEHKEVRQEERHDQHAEAKHEERRRIADDHWRAHFGREHHFAVRHVEVVGGERRFEYGGYRFGFVEPWPAAWAYSDDVYIDLIDGEYFLFNTRHPGVRIAVTVLP